MKVYVIMESYDRGYDYGDTETYIKGEAYDTREHAEDAAKAFKEEHANRFIGVDGKEWVEPDDRFSYDIVELDLIRKKK